MKIFSRITYTVGCLLFFISCNDTCEEFVAYYATIPVYSTTDEVRNAVKFENPKGLENPGKIYSYSNFLFINEVQKGIHIFDNEDPARPKAIGFLSIPGNFDIAIQDKFLYADSYVDLVIFDIANMEDIKEINRLEGVFLNYYSTYGLYDDNQGIVTSFEERLIETSYESECYGYFGREELSVASDAQMNNFSRGQSSGSNTGVGGSMARFTITSEVLYTLDINTLRSFDIAISDSPVQENSTEIGWNMETIFPYNNHLFMGSTTGMHIYSIENALSPQFVSTYEHVNSCDPVVVQGDLAYVTLRSGNECQGFTNQLEVLDISDLSKPELVISYDMENPHGLGIDGNCLFLCEGDFGLKFFNAEDPLNINTNLIAHHTNMNAFDVIPLGSSLLMIGKDGLFQYSYSCTDGDMELLSVIPVAAL